MKAPQSTHGLNFFAIDGDLQAALKALQPEQFARWRDTLADFGAWVGGPLDEQAAYTDRHGRPQLVPYDRQGRLVNRVEYNPAWEDCAREIYRRGIVGLNYIDDPASFLVTFVMGYLTSQSDVSLHCPATMTGAVAHVLARFAPARVRDAYLGDLVRMDGKALSAGTWATELHGGSDIGATTTVAMAEGDHHRLTGLKWFTSNVDGGIAAATARPEGAEEGSRGLGLYLVPWRTPEGSLNPLRIRRLKDKLGTCGVATGEVELAGTYALEVAPPPTGFKLMMEALEFSRIHNAMSAAGLQRRAFLEAFCFAANRIAFGQPIIAYPMVQYELLRIRTDLEADLALALAAAQAFDAAWQIGVEGEPTGERTWLRLTTALAKYQTAENANRACRAAIELIGGNGYTYDFVTPRLLRDAQVLTVWEGPANIQALELLRLLDERYGGFALFRDRVGGAAEAVQKSQPALSEGLRAALGDCEKAAGYIARDALNAARHARRLLALMARLLGAALLAEQAAAGGADSERKALVARACQQFHLAPPPERGITSEAEWIYEAFETLMAPDAGALSGC